MPATRQQRMQDTLRSELSEIILREMRDPRFSTGLLSITEVKVTGDLKQATVYYSVLGDEQARKDAANALRGATGLLRGELGRRKMFNNVPELSFRYDDALERGNKIFDLLEQIKREDALRPKPPETETDEADTADTDGGNRLMSDEISPLSVTIPLAVAEIVAAQTIVLACHVNPDGDALGSMLGLALGIAPLGKTLTILSQDGVPDMYKFLPGVDLVQKTTEIETFDLALVLDSGDLSRVGSHVTPLIQRARRIVDIDHHATAGSFGDVRVLHVQAASTSEIVYALLKALDLPITQEIATCLFTGVITDTGSFRFQNVTPNTFHVAASLLESGAPPAFISENVFENRTFASTKLLGAALSSLSQTAEGRVVWAHITHSDFVTLGATDEDTEGVVNYVRGVRGADVGILFREMGDGKIRISVRSRDKFNAAEVSQQFGGGGHRMAAGCTFHGALADAEQALIAAVLAALPE